jgi:hypothetical protein
MRFAVDAHAIGRHLTGNEVYIRSLLRGFAEIDKHSEFVVCISEAGAESLIPARFQVRSVSANPYRRRDLARSIHADRPDLVHVQYTAPLLNSIPIVVTVHDVSFLAQNAANPEFRVVGRERAQQMVREAARQCGFASRIHFTRFVSDARAMRDILLDRELRRTYGEARAAARRLHLEEKRAGYAGCVHGSYRLRARHRSGASPRKAAAGLRR